MSDYSMSDASLQLGGGRPGARTGEGRPGGGSPVGAVGAGLSKAHKCTRENEGAVNIWVGGSLLRCKKPPTLGQQKGGGKRGKVSEFSKASRRRMLYLVGKIQRVALPAMITLTYPSSWPGKAADWKRHLKNWWHRLKRKVPGVAAIWKLEAQKRGAPHYHLLVWGLDKLPLGELRQWVSRSWYEVVASGDEKHLWAGTNVELVRSRRGVMSYATKYLGKLNEAASEGWDEPGRFWGVKGAENIPWADLFSCALTFGQAVKLLRLMRQAMKCKRGNLPGLTLLSNNPDFWFLRLEEMIT